MREADALAGARDLVRLTATATALEWAAGDLATAAAVALPNGNQAANEPEEKPHSTIVRLEPLRLARQFTIDLSSLHRAHVEPAPGRPQPERMAYVESLDEETARRKIASVLAAIEYIKVDEAAERISNCQSAQTVIKEGVSEDRLLRLFEIARKGDRVTEFVREPLFLIRQPAALALKWASIPREYLVRAGDAP
jgi:hypothetical protein